MREALEIMAPVALFALGALGLLCGFIVLSWGWPIVVLPLALGVGIIGGISFFACV